MADPERPPAAGNLDRSVLPSPADIDDSEIPRKRYHGPAILHHKPINQPTWHLLDHYKQPSDAGRFNVNICLDNAVSIWQKNACPANSELSDEWRIRYEYSELVDISPIQRVASVGPAGAPGLMLQFRVARNPSMSRDFSSQPPYGDRDPSKFPINIKSRDRGFADIRLQILERPNAADYHMTLPGQHLRGPPVVFTGPQMMSLLRGSFPMSQLEGINRWRLKNMEAVRLEAVQLRNSQQTFINASARIERHRAPMHQEINDPEGFGENMQLTVTVAPNVRINPDTLPLVYEIIGAVGGAFDPVLTNNTHFLIPDRKDTWSWEASVLKVVSPTQIKLVVNNDTRTINNQWFNTTAIIRLNPKWFDLTSQIASSYIGAYHRAVSDIDVDFFRTQRSLGILTPVTASSNKPADNPLMTPEELQARNDDDDIDYGLPLPIIMLRSHPAITTPHPRPTKLKITEFSATTNDSQWHAVQQCLINKATIIKGAAATGKSLTLAVVIHQFSIRKDAPNPPPRKILVTAPTNQAVDTILSSTVKNFRFWNIFPRFCRITSEYLVDQDYLKGKWRGWPAHHVQNLRIGLARQRQSEHLLSGVQCFEVQGRIQNPILYRHYKQEREELTASILRTADVMFSTCIGSTSAHRPGWGYAKGFVPSVWICDEFSSAKTYDIVTPISCFPSIEQVIFAGDEKQLAPVYKDTFVQKTLWGLTTMTEMISRGFKVVYLDTQYRSDNSIYDSISAQIYNDTIISHHKRIRPRAYLSNYLAQLPQPVRAQARNRHYTLTNSIHFLHIPGGQEHEVGSPSILNRLQAELVNNLVVTLISVHGVDRRDITVVSPYNGHMRVVKEIAQANGWRVCGEGNVSKVGNVLTVDGSRGTENEIIIFCLVRSTQAVSFVGNPPRANVGLSRSKHGLFIIGDWDWLHRAPNNLEDKFHRILRHYRDSITNFVLRPGTFECQRHGVDLRRILAQQLANIRRERQDFRDAVTQRTQAVQQSARNWPDMKAFRDEIPSVPMADPMWDVLEERLSGALQGLD